MQLYANDTFKSLKHVKLIIN